MSAALESSTPMAVETTATADREPPGSHGSAVPRASSSAAAGGRATLSLRWVVPGVAAALLAGALALAGSTWDHDSRRVLVREVEARLVLEARHLALASSSALLDPFPELTLQPILRDLLKSRPDLEGAVVLDRSGVVQGHPESDRLGTRYAGMTGLAPRVPNTSLAAGESLEGDGARLVARSPVRIPSGEVIGAAIVIMRRSALDSAIASARERRTLVTGVLLAVGTLAMLFSIALLLRPVGALRLGIERIARGELEVPIVVRARNEFGMLADTLNRMAVEVRDAQRRAVEQDRLAREMELARGLQRSLLPRGRHEAGRFALVGGQTAAAEVGGDYYDVVPLEDGRVGFAIADVSGKGIGGCLVMTMLAAHLRGFRDQHVSPARLIAAIDRALAPSLPRARFVTMTYGILDPVTGTVDLAFAGHLPALVYRADPGAVEWVHGHAAPIGAVRKGGLAAMLTDQRVTLAAGDLLVQVTDGYHEAPSPSGEEFALARVESVVRAAGAQGPEAVMQALDRAAAEWTAGVAARDDQTVLVVACAAAGEAAARAPVAPADGTLDALAVLERARREGHALTLDGGLEELPRIREWLRGRDAARPLDPRAERLLESALYETCANAIEHGHGGGPARIDLWHVAGFAPGTGREELFVIRDLGIPFDPRTRKVADFEDPSVRRRGRGLGLAMIHRIMSEVHYAGGTPHGNLTILRFDPRRVAESETGDLRE